MGRLDDVDLTLRLPQEGGRSSWPRRRSGCCSCACCSAARSARASSGRRCACVFEGWDASGKGGAIQRLVDQLDPRHVRVAQFAAPTYDEKRHHFLWRFWPELPGWGGMAVLDRSWYGRVLVERVEGFATEEQWRRAYDEIVDFETTLAAEGMILVKFWMHVSPEEQLRRFERRRRRPAQGVEAHRRGLAQPREARRPTRPPSRTCSSAPTTPPRPWHVVAGRGQALGPRRRRPHRVPRRSSRRSRSAGIDPDPPLT